MSFFNINRNRFTGISVLVMIVMFGLLSCVKDAPIDAFPPEKAASCSDGIQNGGEYRIDCGGPCFPCPIGDPYVTVTIDSTWVADSIKTSNRFWTPNYIWVNDTLEPENLIIHCVDSFKPKDPNFISVTFRIPKDLKRGVHEIDSMGEYEVYASFPPNKNPDVGSFASGIITITNRDDVNGYISGNFEYITNPTSIGKWRVALLDGVFTDIPL